MKLTEIVDNTYSDISGSVLFDWLERQIMSGTVAELSFEDATPISSNFYATSFGNIITRYGIKNFETNIKITDIKTAQHNLLMKYLKS